MKNRLRVFSWFVIVTIQFPALAAAEETLGSVRLERDVLLVEANAPRKTFLEQYEAGLQRLRAEAEKQGLADKIAAIDFELENYENVSQEGDRRYSDLEAMRSIYRDKITPIENARVEEQNRIYAWYTQRLATLEESYVSAGDVESAAEIKKERETTLTLSLGDSSIASGSFIEEFDGPLSSVIWSWSELANIADGAIELSASTSGRAALKLNKGLVGDFKMEMEVERDGEHMWEWWDFGVHLTGIAASAGVRLAYDEENLVFVTPSPERTGTPGNPGDADVLSDSHRGRKTESGTFTIILRDGQLVAGFSDPTGREIRTDPLTVRDYEETNIEIFLGGIPDTPRRIHRFAISRDFSEED